MIKKLILQMLLVMIVLGSFTGISAHAGEVKSLSIDKNANGNPEIVFMDYDGDGYYESFALDRDDDGIVDLLGEDRNKDGTIESFDMDQAEGDMNELSNSLSRFRELREVVKSTYGISNLPDTSVSIKDGQLVSSKPKQPTITPTTTTVKSQPGGTTPRVTVVQPSLGVISISSAPSGAGVSINGQYIGVTPLTLPDVPPGTYSVTLIKDGYEGYSGTTTVTAGGTGRIFATLQPVSVGGDIADIALAAGGVIIVLLIVKAIISKVIGGVKAAGGAVSSTGASGMPRPPPPGIPQRQPASGMRPSFQPGAITCIKCGSPNLTGAKFCAKCGAKLEAVPKPKFCPRCGDPVAGNEKFCDKCGTKLA